MNSVRFCSFVTAFVVAITLSVEPASSGSKKKKISSDNLVEICRREFKVYIYSARRNKNGGITCMMYYSEVLNGSRGGNYNGRKQSGNSEGPQYLESLRDKH